MAEEIAKPEGNKLFNARNVILLLLALLVILNIYFLLKLDSTVPQTKQEEKTMEVSYRYIEPIKNAPIDSNVREESVILHYGNLSGSMLSDIRNFTSEENVGVFVQDVHTGAWLGLNERSEFTPASLLKIPIMMAIFKKVEEGDISLSDKITIKEEDLDPFSGTLYEKGAGSQFTVWQLMKEMVLGSDNTAKNVLKRQLLEVELNAVFAHVGIPNPYFIQNNATVTPRGYTRLFKSLYYSTYLSADLSEKALGLTTDTQDEDLLSAAIPPEIQVAHKYGEWINGIHDCGIVYHPENPYFICVMTKNTDNVKEREIIKRISKTVYDWVNSK